jgi:hypothetical protein
MGRVFGPVQQLGRPLQAEETAQDFEFPLKPVLNLSSLAMLQMQALQIHDDSIWLFTKLIFGSGNHHVRLINA